MRTGAVLLGRLHLIKENQPEHIPDAAIARMNYLVDLMQRALDEYQELAELHGVIYGATGPVMCRTKNENLPFTD